MDCDKIKRIISETKGGVKVNYVQDIWEKVLEILSSRMTSTAINTWFSDCIPVSLEDDRFVICTPGPTYKRDLIQTRYASEIKAALRELFSVDFELLVLTTEEMSEYQDVKKEEKSLPEMDGFQ